MSEKKLLKRIVIDPKKMLGKPVIKGTRLPAELIVEKIAYGETTADIIIDYPFLVEDDIRAALLYAAKRLEYAKTVEQAPILYQKRQTSFISASSVVNSFI